MSISSRSSAASARIVTLPGSACMKPSLHASSRRRVASALPSRTFARSTPGRSAVRYGAWEGRIPTSPSVPTAMTSSASPSNFTDSGVISVNGTALATLAHLFCFGFHFVDVADVEECLLREIVHLAVENLLERTNGVLDLDVLAGAARE